MACAFPFQIPNKHYKPYSAPFFSSTIRPYIEVPCGWCLNCRVDKRNYLEECCNFEYKNFGCGTFLTLTYDDNHIIDLITKDKNGSPVASLKRDHARNFVKSIRNWIRNHSFSNKYCNKNFKVLYVGEYGSKGTVFDRPHFHFLVFGLDFDYCKKLFQKFWQYGFIYSLPILKGGIRYVLKYIDKQQHSKVAQALYDDNNIERPFCFHSLGLGKENFIQQKQYILEHNFCFKGKNNKDIPLPRYWRLALLGKVEFNYDKYASVMRSYNIKPDSSVLNKPRYSLKAMNEFRHKQALIRYENLSNMARSDGQAVYNPYIENNKDNYSFIKFKDMAKCALNNWTYVDGDVIPF